MEQQDRIMDGDLQTLGLQSILKMLALSGKTGTLFVHSGPETLSISLRKGQIVALREEGVPQPDLLVMLCLVNKLDPQRAQMVREHAGGNTQVALAMLVQAGVALPQKERHFRLCILLLLLGQLVEKSGKVRNRLLQLRARRCPLLAKVFESVVFPKRRT